jgi:hypothetical protein
MFSYTGLFTKGVFLNFFLPQPIIHIATISSFQILKIIITESTMASSSVSLTLKHLWRVWKEFCRRCGWLQADGVDTWNTFYINFIC